MFGKSCISVRRKEFLFAGLYYTNFKGYSISDDIIDAIIEFPTPSSRTIWLQWLHADTDHGLATISLPNGSRVVSHLPNQKVYISGEILQNPNQKVSLPDSLNAYWVFMRRCSATSMMHTKELFAPRQEPSTDLALTRTYVETLIDANPCTYTLQWQRAVDEQANPRAAFPTNCCWFCIICGKAVPSCTDCQTSLKWVKTSLLQSLHTARMEISFAIQ